MSAARLIRLAGRCLLAGLGATAISCSDGAPPESAPDAIFTGSFVTLDPDRPEAEAVAVTDGVIVAVGAAADVGALAGAGTTTIDLPGVAVPGWVDAHVHVSGFGKLLEQLNVQAMRKQDIVAAVADAVDTAAPGDWVIGRGWDEGFFDEPVYPTRADLDAVSGDRPVVLTRIGGHSAWVNSAALSAAGITRDTPDPAGGRILRDGAGEPTGMLLEQAGSLVEAAMPPTDTPGSRERQIRLALARYAEWGLTGVHDAGSDLLDIAIFKRLLDAGELPVRVYAMAGGDEAIAAYLESGPETGLDRDRLTIRGVKIYVDGALGARGAELSEPYADAPGTTGLRQMDDAELDAVYRAATDAGLQVSAHVIGDLGVERALDAIERIGSGPAARFRLEHASIVSPVNLPRFAALGAVASMQPVFIGEYHRWGEDRVGSDRLPWVMPVRDIVESGAVLAAGTDFPASDSGDPAATLVALVARRGADGRPEDGWFPEQAVDVGTALRSMSLGPAYAAFREDRLGTIEIGKYADFTVLAADPRDLPPTELGSLDVLMTVVAGVPMEIP